MNHLPKKISQSTQESEIVTILNELGASIKATIKSDFHYGIFVYQCRGKSGDFLLKIIFRNNPQKIMNQKREYATDLFLSGKLQGSPEFLWPRVLRHGESENCFWLCRAFVPGEPLTDLDQMYKNTLWGYDQIRADYENMDTIVMSAVCRALKKLKTVNLNKNDRENQVMLRNRYPKQFKQDILKLTGDVLNIGLNEPIKYFYDNFQHYIQPERKIISLGDLVPANILIGKDKKIYLMDFEFMSIDNMMMDPAFLWLFLWRYPAWQSHICTQLIRNEEDRRDFRLSVIRAILGWFTLVFPRLQVSGKPNTFIGHIWPKYLVTAGESFEALINTK